MKERFLLHSQYAARIALVVGVTNLLACTNQELPKKTPTQTPDALQEVYSEYPELQSSAYPLSTSLHLRLNSHIPTTILNFSPYTLNESALSEAYRAVDFYADSDEPIMVQYLLNGNKIIIVGTGRPNIRSRTTAIVPEGTPRPNWLDDLDLTNITAATKNKENKSQYSYVETALDRRLKNLKFFSESIQNETTLGATIEACQQTLIGGAVDTNLQIIQDSSIQRMAQELLCNSTGLAIASRLLNLPYNEYSDYAKNSSSGNPVSEAYLPLIPFPEDSVREIKQQGSIIR